MKGKMPKSDPNFDNWEAYQEERSELLKGHYREYAVYSSGKRVGLGSDGDEVYRQAREKIPIGVIMVQQILEDGEMPVAKFRSPRFLRRGH